MRKKIEIDRDWLYQKYQVEELTIYEIAEIIECSYFTVYTRLKEFNISIRTRGEANRGDRHWNYGKHPSEETKRKISEANKKYAGDKHPMYGKQVSEETKRKLSEINTGKQLSEETKRKISKSLINLHKHHSKETKQKIAESHKGEKCYMYGKHFPEETKRKLSEAMRGEKNPNYGKVFSEETRIKIREARLRQKPFPRYYTKPERIFEEICKKHNQPFRYTGDGSLWIGKDKVLNPDFIQADGEKVVIEIFGDYWHSPLLNYKLREDANPNYREKHYNKYGWQCIFFWETDLKRADAEQFVLNKLNKVI